MANVTFRRTFAATAIVATMALCAATAVGQTPSPLDGFRAAVGMDFSLVAFRGAADAVLGGPAPGPGLGWTARVGWGRGPVAVSVGVELTAVSLGAGEAMGSLAMPFELRLAPGLAVGPLAPHLVLGYVRYGVAWAEVPAARVPGWTSVRPTEEVGFLGDALRLGMVLGLARGERWALEARPVLDLVRFGQVSVRGEGDIRLDGPGWSRRLGLSVQVSRTF